MASSRLPGKPLVRIHGMPLIGHVWHRCHLSGAFDVLAVATCDKEIADYVRTELGGTAVMTSDKHERASDRTAEAVEHLERDRKTRADIVVMIQGDEPMVTPAMIAAALAPMLADPAVKVVNLMADLENREEQDDPSEVKVVTDLRDNALYFSREPIPSWRKGALSVPMRKQVCVIPFTRDYLFEYQALAPTPLEQIESVDMLRVLEHGERVRMVYTPDRTYAVDTPEDLAFVEARMASDPFRAMYQRAGGA
jgi:3-deoxy-manno-octulosonate cytidylyltransferase (CMP-KDO synthetase)